MKNDKEVFIPKDSTVFEQAEILADMEARQRGFRRGSEEWEAAKQKFLEDRYYHSSIPHLDNPYSPHVPQELYKQYGLILGPQGIIARKHGFESEQYKAYAERFRKAVTALTHIYMELEFGFNARELRDADNRLIQKSSYKLYKGDKADEKRTRDYLRYSVSSILMTMIQTVYSVKRESMIELMNAAKDDASKRMAARVMAPGSNVGKDPRAFFMEFLASIKNIFTKNLQAR